MRTPRLLLTAVAFCLIAWTGIAGAQTIVWLDMSPTPFGTAVPNNSVFIVPGIGTVTLTKSIGANVSDTRSQNANYITGSVGSYNWNNYEYFGTILTTGPDPLVPVMSTITYTFQSTLAPGTVYVGTIGLGSTTSFGGGSSITTVNQNGTFLGDYNGPDNFGPSLFTGGSGTFNVRNSLSGAGGQDPHWNTELGVTRIDDPVSSLTIFQDGIRGDGIGVNIGFVVDPTGNRSQSWGRIKSLYRR